MFSTYAHMLSVWLHNHPHWSGLVAFLISFGESLPILGLIVPGSITMSAVGVLIGSGIIPPAETFIWAIAGASAGDVLSFGLGAYFHQNVKKIWPFNKYPHWLQKGEVFFHQHGGKSIFLGRFIGPMRPVIPLIAGALNMKFKKFFPISLMAAIGWAPAYMLPGIAIGAAVSDLNNTKIILLFILKLFLSLAGLAFVIGCIYFAIQKFVKDSISKKILFIALPLLAFLFITFEVTHNGWLLHWNEIIRSLFLEHRIQWLNQGFVLITFMGNREVLAFVVLALFFYFIYLGFWRTGFIWMINAILIMSSVHFIKHFFHLPRPGGITILSDITSFPSGHVALSTAILGFLTALFYIHKPKRKHLLPFILISTVIILISISRLYLGMHWLTDVLGSIFLGLICIAVSTSLYTLKPHESYSERTMAIFAGSTLLVGLILFSLFNFKKTVHETEPHPLLNKINTLTIKNI